MPNNNAEQLVLLKIAEVMPHTSTSVFNDLLLFTYVLFDDLHRLHVLILTDRMRVCVSCVRMLTLR